MAAGTIGKYERLDVLGHGTSGVVYLAWDTLLRRQVALKEIRADGPETERLLDEARVLDRLKHPNIVRIHSVDVAPGNVILLDMELVTGRNLASLLKERTGEPLPEPEAVRIALSVLDALGYAHERRIIHRDIKPANILVGDNGVVKLTDFGLAEALGTGSVAGGGGTYPYMAPEDFAEDAASDRRSDLWAVGILLYEMLTGRRPFTVQRIKDPFAWKRAVEQDEPPRPTEVNPKLSETWNTLLLRALAKDKEKRFPTAQAFMQAIAQVPGVALPDKRDDDSRSRNSTVNTGVLAFAPPIPGVQSGAFVFTSTGEIVYTLDELLQVAARNWDESRRALLDGRIEGFLRGIGEVYVGELAGDMFRRGHRGESADRLLKEFLERARGEDAPNKPSRQEDMGTVVAPRFRFPQAEKIDTGTVVAPATPRPAERREPNEEETPSVKPPPGVRWWYWPVLALCAAPTGAAMISLAQPGIHSDVNPAMFSFVAGAVTGLLATMLMLIAVGTRMSWFARLLPLLPMGMGGLCIGGIFAQARSMGVNISATEILLLCLPFGIILVQAATAKALWRLWLGVLTAAAATAVGFFAAIR